MTHWNRRWLPALIAGAVIGLGPAARADDGLPPLQTQDGIEWMSGGVGQDEVQAMKREAPHWPLALSFAQTEPNQAVYTADVDVNIQNAAHYEVLKAHSNGPFMLVRLKPGRYTLEATLDGRTVRRSFTITAQAPAQLTLLWPSRD